MGILSAIGSRLREERLRLSLTLDELAVKAGAHANSLGNYENGKSPINMAMLLVLQDLGYDIGYVVTGLRSNGELGSGDTETLRLISLLSHREREAVMLFLYTLAGETVSHKDIMPKDRASLHAPAPRFTPAPKED